MADRDKLKKELKKAYDELNAVNKQFEPRTSGYAVGTNIADTKKRLQKKIDRIGKQLAQTKSAQAKPKATKPKAAASPTDIMRQTGPRRQVLAGPKEKPVSTKTITVKKGDTLSQLAQQYGTTLASIKKLNPQIADLNKIKVGQKINITPKTSKGKGVYAGMSKSEMAKIVMPKKEEKTQARRRRGPRKAGSTFRKKGGSLGRGMGVALRGGGKVMK